MKKLLVAAFFASLWFSPAQAQSTGRVVSDCTAGVPNGYGIGSTSLMTMNAAGQACITGSISASLAAFHAEASLTPITATTGGVTSSSFTAGKATLVSNTGATNTAFCAPGASATTSSTPILPGQTVEIQTTSETQITCVTSTSTATVSIQTGTGLAAGWGGSGAGGGSSGAVFGPTAVGSSGVQPPVTIGGTQDGTQTGTVAAWKVLSGSGYMNMAQWNGVALGSPSAFGTTPGAVNVPGVNAWIVGASSFTQPVSGPTAVGSANANPPVVIGGTATGAAGQNVEGVAVKPASTAPLATDLSMVVTESPNSPLLTTASTCLAGTAYNTNTPITTGVVGGITCTVNGNVYVSFSGTPTIANGNGVVPTQGGTALSATNGMFDNLLQGNAVLSATNGLYSNILQGNAALSATNGLYGNILQGNAVLSATNPIFSSITDGTNKAAVKAANTAPTTSDPGLVANINCSYTGAPCITLGQTTKSASVPVTIASDQYVDPCQNAAIAKSSAPINVTSATTTTLVAVSGSTTVYVCGYSFSIAPSATAADSALLEYGSGTACATSPQALTGTYGSGDLTTAAPPTFVHFGGAGQTVAKSAASNGICLVSAGTTINIQGILSYVQQ